MIDKVCTLSAAEMTVAEQLDQRRDELDVAILTKNDAEAEYLLQRIAELAQAMDQVANHRSQQKTKNKHYN